MKNCLLLSGLFALVLTSACQSVSSPDTAISAPVPSTPVAAPKQYEPLRPQWLRNVAERQNPFSGTAEWTQFAIDIPVTADDAEIAILLRSEDNTGSAWFDDLELFDGANHPVRSFSFDSDSCTFRPERDPVDAMSHDASVGHATSGSLRITNTKGYNGWISNAIATNGKAETYKLTGWVLLSDATGMTYPAAAINGYPKE